MKTAASALLAMAVCCGGCLSVPGDRILARDLAGALPALAAVAPDREIGFAPAPGSRRIYTARDIAALFQRFGITPPAQQDDLCLQRATEVVSPERLSAAIGQALAARDASVEVLDYGRYPLPLGRLDFSRAGLALPPLAQPDAPVLWRGKLIDESGKSWTVWAKVRILVEAPALVAVSILPRGAPIRREQIALVLRKGFPTPGIFLMDPGQALGKVAKRDIGMGQPLTATMIEEARAVESGDSVQVTAMSGTAEISFVARAQTGGKKGDAILLRNPSSGRSFRGVIVDKGKALVQADNGGRGESGG